MDTGTNGSDLARFARAMLRDAKQVGAVAPSSTTLGRRLAAVVPQRDGAVVVELGAGTGSVTACIDERRSPRSEFLAFEADPELARPLAARAPGVRVIADDARRLGAYLAEYDVTSADAIVCGLPWANFTADEQNDLMDTISRGLAPGAAFTTFAYVHALGMPAARRFRAELERRFDEMLPTRTIFRNLPPAITYVCRRPRT